MNIQNEILMDVHGSCARSIQTGDSYGVLERQSAVLADLDRRSLVQSLDLHGAALGIVQAGNQLYKAGFCAASAADDT